MGSAVDLLAPLAAFAGAMSFTPGPNNLLLASAGARFGYRRTLPHQAGVVAGFVFLTLAGGAGMARLLASTPRLEVALKGVSLLYLSYLAFRIATAGEARETAVAARPMGFTQAVLFQWVNPKAWMIVLGAMSTFVSPLADARLQIMLVTAVLTVSTMLSVSAWTAFGLTMGRVLKSPARRRAFNVSMAALLVASIVPEAPGLLRQLI